ncbi:MAG: hypothetical protein Q7R66_12295 [Undibacterium sp.]|uniref:type IV pilus assembly protein FimV n=1 Tax=Undibacterium sp. TaxID=1914977 RepID=UPI00272343C8|nr:hypothetical protein [Undibacterium sp.]MDO8652960.1 hypothetical protein [Undibacterium sp.]
MSTFALGLAELRVQSGLGQPLKAQVSLVGSNISEISQTCIRANVESTEGSFIAQANVSINQAGQNKSIFLSTRERVLEPAVKIIVDINCETQLHREFLILLDPPQFLPAQIQSESLSTQQKDVIQGQGLTTKRSQNPIDITGPKKSVLVDVSKDRKGSIQNNTPDLLVHSGSKSRKATKAGKDVLKLSDDSLILQQGLKISDSLSSLDRQIVENKEELRTAQAHMAAILRDESPDQIMKLEQAIGQKKILILQNETVQLKRQNQIDKSILEELKKNSYPRNWIIALSTLALIALIIVIILSIYIYRLHKTTEMSWWEHGKEKKDAERRKSIEDIVNNVQASYEPSIHNSEYPSHATLGPESVSVTPTASIAQTGITASVNNDEIFQTYPVRAQPLTLEETNSSTFNFFSTRGSSVNVEEISDVTQEAEFWMSVNDPQRAIEILEPQASIEHPDSPVPWLYLLDLYRVVKSKEKYDSLRDRFIIFFNANIPEFAVEPEHGDVRQLEDFPHLTERICSMWNGNEMIPFLQSLLVDDRDGKRMGFELPVYRDILLLISIAHELERIKAIEGGDSSGWSAVSDSVNVDASANNNKPESGQGMIEFEAIDFPRVLPKE